LSYPYGTQGTATFPGVVNRPIEALGVERIEEVTGTSSPFANDTAGKPKRRSMIWGAGVDRGKALEGSAVRTVD